MYQTFFKPFGQDLKKLVFDILFPVTCLSCGKEREFLCLFCRSGLKKIEHQQCIVCQKSSPFGFTHPGCKTPHEPDGALSFFDYHDSKISESLIKGKYTSFIKGIYEVYGKLVAAQLSNNSLLISNRFFLVPIPLSKYRKRWRGFNQAEVLCQSLSVHLNLPILDALIRTRSTKTQKDLKKDQRLKNIEGAFASVSPPKIGGVDSEAGRGGIYSDSISIKNKNLILVDDILTTGSTMREAAKVLKRNGAAQVWCLTIARD